MPFPLRLEPKPRSMLDALATADRWSLTNYLMKVIEEHVTTTCG
jgi:hypothetical protein